MTSMSTSNDAKYFIPKKLWPLVVFEVLILVVQAEPSTEAQDVEATTSQSLSPSLLTEQSIDWSKPRYCTYEGNEDVKKVFIRRCLQEDPLDSTVCGPEDERIRFEPGDSSCRSNSCVLVLTVGSISGVVLILVTLGLTVYFYKRNPNTDRKLLSENIYDEAVYNVRHNNHHDQRFPEGGNNKVNGGRESIELIENDLYDMDIPSPRSPTDRKSMAMFRDNEYNIYEAVP